MFRKPTGGGAQIFPPCPGSGRKNAQSRKHPIKRAAGLDPRTSQGVLPPMALMQIKIDSSWKRQIQATAALHGVSLQAFVLHALKFTMNSMVEQGTQVAPPPTAVQSDGV